MCIKILWTIGLSCHEKRKGVVRSCVCFWPIRHLQQHKLRNSNCQSLTLNFLLPLTSMLVVRVVEVPVLQRVVAGNLPVVAMINLLGVGSERKGMERGVKR